MKIPVSLEVAEDFRRESVLHPEKFATPEAFREYFKGIYVTTEAKDGTVMGNGSIMYISHTEIELCFDTKIVSNTTGIRDSLVVGAAYFPVTKEVKQINRAYHRDLSKYIQPSTSDSLNYIYSPAGMFTKVTIPQSLFTKGSNKSLSGKTICNLNLKVTANPIGR